MSEALAVSGVLRVMNEHQRRYPPFPSSSTVWHLGVTVDVVSLSMFSTKAVCISWRAFGRLLGSMVLVVFVTGLEWRLPSR